jgi:hypothetical protein
VAAHGTPSQSDERDDDVEYPAAEEPNVMRPFIADSLDQAAKLRATHQQGRNRACHALANTVTFGCRLLLAGLPMPELKWLRNGCALASVGVNGLKVRRDILDSSPCRRVACVSGACIYTVSRTVALPPWEV